MCLQAVRLMNAWKELAANANKSRMKGYKIVSHASLAGSVEGREESSD